MNKLASKVAKPAKIQPKSQFLFHKNVPPRDFSIMTLFVTLLGMTNEVKADKYLIDKRFKRMKELYTMHEFFSSRYLSIDSFCGLVAA